MKSPEDVLRAVLGLALSNLNVAVILAEAVSSERVAQMMMGVAELTAQEISQLTDAERLAVERVLEDFRQAIGEEKRIRESARRLADEAEDSLKDDEL
jgi:hypothetical protein